MRSVVQGRPMGEGAHFPVLEIAVDGAKVTVRSPDGRFQETHDNAMAFSRDGRGGRKVVAVGMSRERLCAEARRSPPDEQARAEQGLASVEVVPAFDRSAFDPELAAGFIDYVALSARGRRDWRKVTVHVSMEGFDVLAFDERARFLRAILGVRLCVNGRRRWTRSADGESLWRAALLAEIVSPLLLLVLGKLGRAPAWTIVLVLGWLPGVALLELLHRAWCRREIRRSLA